MLAYEDDELPPSRQAAVHVHVQQCQDCRARVNALREVGRQIRADAPAIEDPAGLAALKARLATLPLHTPTRSRGPSRARVMAGAVTLAVVVLAGYSVVSNGAVVEGGSTFARWLIVDGIVARVTPQDNPGQSPIIAPTGAPEQSDLPLGLGQVGEEQRRPGYVTRHYSAPNGLSILFAAERAGQEIIGLPDDPELRRIVPVNGRDVLLVFGMSASDIVTIYWSDGDILVSLFILTQPDGGLDADAALEIAASMMEKGVELP
ncbi:MAG TPA: zf-HC2 domain-containing protein [Thermomicrobiales bacterium]|nr:zf-HC2 domain-containing protein [Thermomicrobiales bacterium]